MMKRVLLLVPSLGMGGMERVCINYANLLDERGYKVSLYNLSSDSPMIVNKLSKNVIYKKNILWEIPNIYRAGFRNIFCGNYRFLPGEGWIKWTDARKLYKKLITDNPEMFDIEIAFYGGNMMKILTGSVQKASIKIGWIHSPMIESHYRLFINLKQAIETYKKMDMLCCVSEEVQKKARKLFGEDINANVILNPNDTTFIRKQALSIPENLNKTGFTFINASRIEIEVKGLDRLTEAVHRLKKEGFDFTVWILGNGKEMETLKTMIADKKLDKVIVCLGAQENPYQYMSKADCYICSSRSEGFSMVVAEAVILGLPVISTNISGAHEMLGNSEYGIVTENSTEGIYSGMKELLESDEKKRWIKRQAEKRKDFLNEQEIINRFEEMLSGISTCKE